MCISRATLSLKLNDNNNEKKKGKNKFRRLSTSGRAPVFYYIL